MTNHNTVTVTTLYSPTTIRETTQVLQTAIINSLTSAIEGYEGEQYILEVNKGKKAPFGMSYILIVTLVTAGNLWVQGIRNDLEPLARAGNLSMSLMYNGEYEELHIRKQED